MAVRVKHNGCLLAQNRRHESEELANTCCLDQILYALTSRQVADCIDQVGLQRIHGYRAISFSKLTSGRVWLDNKKQFVVSDDVSQVLSEEQSGRSSSADED